MKQRAKKYFLTALKLLISVAALYYVFRNTDLKSLQILLLNSNPLLLICALLLFVVSKAISATRLNIFLKAAGVKLDNLVNLKLYLLGMYYNLFLPGGIGGDGYKVYYLNKHSGTSIKTGISVILFDRVTGVLALVFMSLLLIIFVPELQISSYLGISAALLLIVGFYFIVNKWFKIYFIHLNRTNIQSLGVQVAQLICAFLILLALGEKQDVLTYLFVFLVSSVIAVIPFTLGGIGARELTFLYAARMLDLNVTVSVSLSLLFFVITALVSMGGIYYSIRPQKIMRTDL